MRGTVLFRERPEGRLFHCWRHMRWFTVRKLKYCERIGCVCMFEEGAHPSKRWKYPGMRVRVELRVARKEGKRPSWGRTAHAI